MVVTDIKRADKVDIATVPPEMLEVARNALKHGFESCDAGPLTAMVALRRTFGLTLPQAKGIVEALGTLE